MFRSKVTVELVLSITVLPTSVYHNMTAFSERLALAMGVLGLRRGGVPLVIPFKFNDIPANRSDRNTTGAAIDRCVRGLTSPGFEISCF